MRRIITFTILCSWCLLSYANKILNVYTWANYIPTRVIHQFEDQTGIHVNVNEYDSNAVLYAKLAANPHIGYDIIIPSSYYVSRMRKQGMLHPLDKSKLPNLKYINPRLLNLAFDKGNQYSLPFTWGATGILIDKRYWHAHNIQHWQDLWQPRFKNQLLMLDDAREVFAIALITLGYSINDTNPAHIKAAYEKLKKLMPNIKVFNSDAITNLFADQDVTIGMSWNGEANLAQQANSHLVFIYPQQAFAIWIDCLSIPKYAPDVANAYQFINFIMQPNIAKEITLSNGYSTPNLAALKQLPARFKQSNTTNPSPQTLKRGQLQVYIGSARELYEHYWQLLKLGDR